MTYGSPLSQPCRTGQHRSCAWDGCTCPHHADVTMRTADCPLRCGWRTPQQVLQLELDPARERLQPATDRILEHLAAEHRDELLHMVAGMEGGRGVPVVASVVQHVSTDAIRGAEDVVLSTLIPRMRAQLAQHLASKNMRPLDPWPAVQVERYVWADRDHYSATMLDPDAQDPPGMRRVRDGERVDLYRLELRTLAVQDSRPPVQL